MGGALVDRFVAEQRMAGAPTVVLTTDARDNEAVNRFYQNIGFRENRKFEAGCGRQMIEYLRSG